jgi:hypothetical protein
MIRYFKLKTHKKTLVYKGTYKKPIHIFQFQKSHFYIIGVNMLQFKKYKYLIIFIDNLNLIKNNVACAVGPSVITSSTDLIFPFQTWLFGIYLNFQW